MLKFFTNLLFIVILFLLVSGMPVNTELMELNPFRPVVEQPSDTETIDEYTLELIEPAAIYNPDSIQFQISSSGNSLPDNLLDQVTLSLTGEVSDSILYKVSDLQALSTVSSGIGTKTYSLDLGAIYPDLPMGSYTLHLDVDAGAEHFTGNESMAFDILSFDKTYLWSSNKESSGQLTMTLYMPTKDYQYLVPLTRSVPYPENRSRTTYKALHAGPKEGLGLLEGEGVIPYASKIYISQGLASVYIYWPEQNDFEDTFDTVVESVTNSLGSLDFVDSAKFYIDNADSTPFGGVDLKAVYTPTTDNNVYVGYSNESDYMMLLPIHLSQVEETSDDPIHLIWDVLVGQNTSYPASPGLFTTIPANVRLNDYTLTDEGYLTLDVSSEFIEPFQGENEYINLMMDSILYSYTSLDTVNSVQITIDGQVVTDYFGYNLSIPNTPNLHINLEP